MNDKEEFEALSTLAKFRMDRATDRSRHEIQLSLTIWAFMAAATAYFHSRPPEKFLIPALILIAILHAIFVIEVRVRNRLDIETAFYFFERAEKLISSDAPKPRARPDYEARISLAKRNWSELITRDFWWSGAQIVLTVVLAAAVFLLLGISQCKTA